MARQDGQRGVPLPFVVAWAVFATYLVAARVVGNLFPLSVFDMYQSHAPEVAARVVVLDAAGREAELDHFEGFVCESEPVSLLRAGQSCGPDHRPLHYVVRDQELWIEAHRGGDAATSEPITIVSRARSVTREPVTADCVIARCYARRRGGSL